MDTNASNGQTVYTGRDVPTEKYDEVFDTTKLTDERIEKELKNNQASLDYIFCPDCESRLSKWLETPYSQYLRDNKPAEGYVAYMFWLSVFWRVSRFEQFDFRFSECRENEMRKALYGYFISKETGGNLESVLEYCSFRYRIVQDEEDTALEDRAIFGRYKDDVAIMMSVCVNFDRIEPKDVGYCGFEDLFRDAPINDGNSPEKIQQVNHAVYKDCIQKYRQYYSRLIAEEECDKLDLIWNRLGCPGHMPKLLKQSYIQRLYDEEVKIGDRLLPERRVQILIDLLYRRI